MIEILLKLIDRIIDLKKYQVERLQKTFRDVLDPLFNDLLSVHGDYVRMFEDVRAELTATGILSGEARQHKLLEIAESLRRQRLEFEPVRDKLTALTRELRSGIYAGSLSFECPEADEFVAAILQYFPRADLSTRTSRSSVLLVAIQTGAIITAAQVTRDGKSLPELVDATIEDCRQKWQSVCDAYAKLKLAVRAA
jgi:hypothetical protein